MSPYKFQQLAPTPARGKFDPKLYTDKEWWAEIKYDGDRRIAQFIGGRVRFTGRRISDVDGLYVEKTDNLPHINTYEDKTLHGTVLDGEIVCEWKGARSKDVTSIMGSKPELAIAKQKERGWVSYKVFDCLFYKGEDLREEPLAYRRQMAEQAVREWRSPLPFGRAHVDMALIEKKKRIELFADVCIGGGEGIILKHMGSAYAEEKLWVKVKKEATHDVVITGYEAAKKTSTKVTGETSETKYHKLGLIGAVTFGQYLDGKLVECGKCSGMDDATREALSFYPKENLGRVIEILANEREPTGRFRHPRFVRFRDDRDAKSCIWRKE